MPLGFPLSSVLFKYVAGGLLFVSLVLGASLWAEKRSSGKKDNRITELAREVSALEIQLLNISREKDNQATVTTRTVERAIKEDPQVRVVTRTIREAPLPADCKTPALDVLRDTL